MPTGNTHGRVTEAVRDAKPKPDNREAELRARLKAQGAYSENIDALVAARPLDEDDEFTRRGKELGLSADLIEKYRNA